MKIAVMGSAPSSVMRAPWRNSAYQAYQEAKTEELARTHGDVPGDFEIWGCSPGLWAVAPRATRWFELHRWEPGQAWLSPEYVRFLREFKGPVYTGGKVPEIPNHVMYPIDLIEEKFSSYFLTSSLALMLALAIDTIEHTRTARESARRINAAKAADPDGPQQFWSVPLPDGVNPTELDKPDDDDVIGMWGVDMAAAEEYGYQRPGCQFFVLEAMRRGIAVYLPPESDLMRPMPVYGISEWDHNYVKLTSRARELNAKAADAQKQLGALQTTLTGAQAEMHALEHFVQTWTSPYGMQHGLVIRQAPGTGLGSGITHLDGRPVTRMAVGEQQVMEAMAEPPDVAWAREFVSILNPLPGEHPTVALRRIISERDAALAQLSLAVPVDLTIPSRGNRKPRVKAGAKKRG
jgi:hypothetical protein